MFIYGFSVIVFLHTGRLTYVYVRVGETDIIADQTVCGQTGSYSDVDRAIVEVICSDTQHGRYVSLQKDAIEAMNFCEVIVTTIPPNDYNKGKAIHL